MLKNVYMFDFCILEVNKKSYSMTDMAKITQLSNKKRDSFTSFCLLNIMQF